MTSSRSFTAVWGGRFQPPHVGHEAVLDWCIEQYGSVCISIVNPTPTAPPVPGTEFGRFRTRLNPLTYLERAFLWYEILRVRRLEGQVVIAPAWHPRKSLALEETFLPPRNGRVWVIPEQDEEETLKVLDFEGQGERIDTSIDLGEGFRAISGARVRKALASGTGKENLLSAVVSTHLVGPGASVPTVRDMDLEFLVFEDPSHVGDVISYLKHNSNRQDSVLRVLAIPVRLAEEPEWWRKPAAVENDKLTFYDLARYLQRAAGALLGSAPLIIPLLLLESGKMIDHGYFTNAHRRWAFYSHWGGGQVETQLRRQREDIIVYKSHATLSSEELSKISMITIM